MIDNENMKKYTTDAITCLADLTAICKLLPTISEIAKADENDLMANQCYLMMISLLNSGVEHLIDIQNLILDEPLPQIKT